MEVCGVHVEIMCVETINGDEAHFLVVWVDHMAHVIDWVIQHLELLVWWNQLSHVSVAELLAH